MTHLLKIFSMTHIWLIWYAIYILYDFKFQFWSSDIKIFEIRLRKFLKSNFLENAWAENFFRLQIRIQRKISRRMVYNYMGSLVILPTICMKIVIAWVLNAIFGRNGCKRNIFIYKHIPVDAKFYAESEFEVKKIFPPTHFRENSIWKICVGVSQKFWFHWIRIEICSHMICILYIIWVNCES